MLHARFHENRPTGIENDRIIDRHAQSWMIQLKGTIMKNHNLRETKNEITMCVCSFVADSAHVACKK